MTAPPVPIPVSAAFIKNAVLKTALPASISVPPTDKTAHLQAKKEEYERRMSEGGEGPPAGKTMAEFYSQCSDYRLLWAKWAVCACLLRKQPNEEVSTQMLCLMVQGELKKGGKQMTPDKPTFNDAVTVIAHYLGQTRAPIFGGTGFAGKSPKNS